MRADELDFELPAELIAQEPAAERAASRLMHYRQTDRSVMDRRFAELPELLRPGDLLVFNDTRVLPARFTLRKSTGGLVEGLFISETSVGNWNVLLKNVGSVSKPVHLTFQKDPALEMVVHCKLESGGYVAQVNTAEPASIALERMGRMPLPPYIKRGKESDERDALDLQRYQTVFNAGKSASVAAPTAGLHFSDAMMDQLQQARVLKTFITLNVGMGTFKPVSAETLEAHEMHSESYCISSEAAEQLNRAKVQKRRIISVGTTVTRVLESQLRGEPFVEKTGDTKIFIYPPYDWKHISAMITNFHLPKSTLIALVAARIGLEEQRRLYQRAIKNGYRFFSYGDAMFLDAG